MKRFSESAKHWLAMQHEGIFNKCVGDVQNPSVLQFHMRHYSITHCTHARARARAHAQLLFFQVKNKEMCNVNK